MPDLNGGRKLTSKTEAIKKFESGTRTSHSSSAKAGDKRKPERESARSPPRRRVARRSRSSSSGSSDSSSSRSGSADSSSGSSHSSKNSPKKTVQQKHSKASDRPKAASRSQGAKPDSTSAKQDDSRAQRESLKKPLSSNDDPKAAEPSRTDSQVRNKSASVIVTENSSTSLPHPLKSTSAASEDKPDPSKQQSAPKPSSKSSKLNAAEADKTTKERSKSPVSIPPFTRVLVEKLTRNVNKAHVTEIFSVWGEVASVEMPPDRLHPEFSRSYAYVTYANPKCAADAVNFMNGGQIDGETIRVTEIFSRPSASVRAEADSVPTESSQYRDRGATKREADKTADSARDRKGNFISSTHRRVDDVTERSRDHDRSGANDQDRRRDLQDKDRRDRDRDRERDRQRDRSRELDRPRRARRGSSGSPFASRLGAAVRQRSPLTSSRYRRASPLSSRPEATSRRGRSRSPKPIKPVASRSAIDSKNSASRRGRGASRSSSSSSSDSGSSNTSSSSSHSGSSSSSSSSTSTRSRS